MNMEHKTLTATVIAMALTSCALAQGSADDPLVIITTHINSFVCDFLHLLLFVSGGITAVTIIFAGVKYMTSDNPGETTNARNIVIYALTGLTCVLLACPVVDMLVTGTDIVPLQQSCQCYILDLAHSTTTTTTTTSSSSSSSSSTPSSSSSSSSSLSTTSSTSFGTTTTTTTIAYYTNPTICKNAEDSGNCMYLCGLPGTYYKTGYCCSEWGKCCGLSCP